LIEILHGTTPAIVHLAAGKPHREKYRKKIMTIGAITRDSAGEQLSAIGSMKNTGIVAIFDDGKPVMNARVMRRAMGANDTFSGPAPAYSNAGSMGLLNAQHAGALQ
jgi:dihydroorotase-like cyclic amidohydrolase